MAMDEPIQPPDIQEPGADIFQRTESYVRANPIPALLGAVAVGFALGLIARSLETQREPEPIRDAVREIRSLLKPLAKKTRKAYAESSDAVRDAVEQAVEKAKEIEVDRYVDPVTSWWKRLWA